MPHLKEQHRLTGSSGYDCVDNSAAGWACHSTATPGAAVSGFSVPFEKGCAPLTDTTLVVEGSPTAVGSAEAVLLIRSGVGSGNADDPKANQDNTQAGLASSAKIAIGVVVPVVFIVIGMLLFLFLRRRARQKKHSVQGAGATYDPQTAATFEKGELQGSNIGPNEHVSTGPHLKPELESTASVPVPQYPTELEAASQHQSAVPALELDSHGVALPMGEVSPSTRLYELDAN